MKKIISLILIFGLLFAIFLFFGLFIKSIYSDYLIKPIAEEGHKINQDQQTNIAIDNAITWYDNFNLPYDMLFLIFWVFVEMSIVYYSINSVKLPGFDFSSFLFFGILFVFLVFDLISQITNWFYIEFISNIFNPVNLSIYTFYLQNHSIIVFLNIMFGLIINQFFGKDKINNSMVV